MPTKTCRHRREQRPAAGCSWQVVGRIRRPGNADRHHGLERRTIPRLVHDRVPGTDPAQPHARYRERPGDRWVHARHSGRHVAAPRLSGEDPELGDVHVRDLGLGRVVWLGARGSHGDPALRRRGQLDHVHRGLHRPRPLHLLLAPDPLPQSGDVLRRCRGGVQRAPVSAPGAHRVVKAIAHRSECRS